MKLFYKNILKALKKHKNIMLGKKDHFCYYNIILLPLCFSNLKLVVKYSDAIYEQVVEAFFALEAVSRV